ncbi:zinc ABC transporter substrate-binding protein AztC [Rathayibacter sp. VKM Ac-2760]|uniref:zinc ABC transporter substrate-binding protein AztC n=1 Tax=Rathayibacter sp. VKM Ac-2760 TaxID=2609253 RepID=UPI00131944F4|nr:zinc ABC transporter substrate-binding protein AztC [Rathayibacter sp. VKM Ac-2760]QHC60228.1 zinc ABC transporter solute-binding protein [Rathayibacter sp. VKM Ac-2760]
MSRLGRLLAASAALSLAAVTAGCASTAATDGPLVVVTTNILGDVVGELVGDGAEVLTLMAPDADPHSFEISAREAARLLDADLIVSNGLGLEEGLQQHVDAAEEAGVPVVAAGALIEPLAYSEGDAEGEPDPHFWTDPRRMIEVVDALAPALAGAGVPIEPEAYRAELVALDAELATAFGALPEERRALVTNHHVFGYLAERYGFRVIGAVLPSGTTLAAPSASDLEELTGAIEEAGVPAIFADASQPDRLAQVLAEEADLDVDVVALYTESLTAPDGGAPTYLDMMRANARLIVTGLSP